MIVLKDMIVLGIFLVTGLGMAISGLVASVWPTYRFPDESTLHGVSGAPVEISQVNQYKARGGEFRFRVSGQEPEFMYIQNSSDGSTSALTVRSMLSNASAVSFRRSPLPEPWEVGERFRAYDLSVDGRTVQTYAQVKEALTWEHRVYGPIVGLFGMFVTLLFGAVALDWLRRKRVQDR